MDPRKKNQDRKYILQLGNQMLSNHRNWQLLQLLKHLIYRQEQSGTPQMCCLVELSSRTCALHYQVVPAMKTVEQSHQQFLPGKIKQRGRIKAIPCGKAIQSRDNTIQLLTKRKDLFWKDNVRLKGSAFECLVSFHGPCATVLQMRQSYIDTKWQHQSRQ